MPISRNALLYSLTLANFAHIVDVMILMPLGDVIMKELLISPFQLTILISCYSGSAFAAGIVGAFVLDSFDRKKALLFILFGFSIGTIACGLVSSYAWLVAVRSLTGVFGGITGGLILAIISDMFPFSERGRAIGLLSTSFSLASILGVPLSLLIADNSHWQVPFLVIGGFATAIALFLLVNMPSLQAKTNSEVSKLQLFLSIFRDPNQRWGLSFSFVMVLSNFLVIPFLSPFMIRNVGLLQTEIKYIYLLGGIATVVSARLIGFWVDKYKPQRIYTYALLLLWSITIVITHQGQLVLGIALLLSTIFFMSVNSRFIAAQTLITATPPIETRAGFMSLNSSLQQLAIGTASFVGGFVISENPDGSLSHYNLLAYLSVFIGVFTLWIVRRIKVA
jgi:predicted MFS family arabinose efflux permease